MVSRILIWLYLNFIGIKFYRLNFVPTENKYRHTQCVTYDGKLITFKFHLVTQEEFRYMRSGVFSKLKTSLLIHAEYDDNLPESIRKWNNLAFCFPGIPRWCHKQRFISEMMLLAYLDFIKGQK